MPKLKLLFLCFLTAILLNLTACSNGTDSSTVGEVSDDPTQDNQPQNLRAVAYTYTEIELFWTNPVGSSAIQWEVERDGEVVATVPGPSFYESGLQELTQYRYRVTPLNAQGERGPVAETMVVTLENAPVITPDSAQPLSMLVMQQLSLEPLVPYLGELQQAYYTLFPNSPYQGHASCPNGGSATTTRTPFEFGTTAGGVSMKFERCVIEDSTWNGSLTFRQQSFLQQTGDNGEHASCRSEFTDLSLQQGEALPVEVTGTLTGRGELHHGYAFDGRLVQRMEQGSVLLDANIDVAVDSSLLASGSYSLQSQETGNRPLTITLSEDLHISSTDNIFQAGAIEVSDPLGGIMNITIGYQAGQLQWKTVTDSALGHSEEIHSEENSEMPMLIRWPVGTDCQLIYPPDGKLIEQSGDLSLASNTDPFAPVYLVQTLDTIFFVEQAGWVEESMNELADLPERVILNGGAVTEIASNEATLLQETIEYHQWINPETNEVETVEYVLFSVDEKVAICPSGGRITWAVKYAGPYVYRRTVADDCIIEGTTYAGELNRDWIKYSGNSTINNYSRSDLNAHLEVDSATSSTYSAFYLEDRAATRIVFQAPGKPKVTIENFAAEYNQHRDSEMGDYSSPVSTATARILIGDNDQVLDLITDGKLHYLSKVSVEEQGSLLASSIEGSTLTITPGNGDNESFDVDVKSSNGYSYVMRLPYSDRHNIRIDGDG